MRATALLVVLAAGCGDTTLFDMMERQPKYKPYAPNPFYADGRSMRQAPAGTVPRERLLGQPEVTTGKTASGEDLREFPVALTADLLALGRKKFDIYCAVCHGLAGDGQSPVASQMSLRQPPSLHLLHNVVPGHLFQVISQGFGLMPAYAAQLEPRERWAVAAYVHALRRSQAATLSEAPPDVQKELQK